MAWLTRAQAAALTEDQRLDYMTRTVLGEAVSEGYTGMLIVAQVIQNRSEDGRWPSDPVAVAGQSWQFTTNSPGTGGNQTMVSRNYGPGTSQYKMAQAAVRAAIIEQSVPDITGDAKYYHTTAMGWPSSWPSSIKRNGFIDIGRHRVYPDHPVPPGEIPAKLASLQYIDGEVGTFLSTYDERGIKPIRPATMGSATRLTRELNRVAEQKANATEAIKRSRAFAFGSTIDPFDVGRPSIGGNPIINRPQPAIKSSMQAEIDSRPRATGTPTTTERTFAQLTGGQGLDAPGLTLVSSGQRPPAVQAAPWGVREDVAATVAATDAANGRGQITMTGNPNIPGAVVAWLYPQIKEGEGEANQEGKGAKAVGRSMIERGEPRQRDVPQSTIERGKPIVVVDKGQARVVPQSVIERPDVVAQSVDRANKANDPALAASLAASIASRRPAPAQSTIERGPARKVAAPATKPVPGQSPIERTTLPKPPVVAQPAGSTAPKETTRLPAGNAGIDYVPPASTPGKLPPVAPPRSNPIGIMPKFSDLNALQPPARLTAPKSPTPASTKDRELARDSTLFGQPAGPTVAPTQPELPRPRPDRPTAAPANDTGPTTRTVPTKRVTTTAPVPASVEDRVTARNRNIWAKPVVTTQRPGLRVVVQRDRPVTTRPAAQAPAPAAKPAALYYRDPKAFGAAAVAQSGDTSSGSQADAAAARASGDAWREAQAAKTANDLYAQVVR
jgi:hypothetical protein